MSVPFRSRLQIVVVTLDGISSINGTLEEYSNIARLLLGDSSKLVAELDAPSGLNLELFLASVTLFKTLMPRLHL